MNLEYLFENIKSNISNFGLSNGLRLTFNSYSGRYRSNFALAEEYISKKYSPVIEKYLILEAKNIAYEYNDSNEKYVWALWLTGYENAPEIVKRCGESLSQFSEGYQIVLLDEKNIENYIHIPKHIWDKYRKGIIKPAHFSDIVRVKLLSKYAGIWLDAKVLLTGHFIKEVGAYKFYSPHRESNPENYKLSIADHRWICGVMSTNVKDNILFSFVSEMYDRYWEDHDKAIVYLLLDTLIDIAVNKFNSVRNDINSVPITNDTYYLLSRIMNNTFDEKEWNEIKRASNLHILSTKTEIDESSNTFYSRIIKNGEY